MQYIDRMGMVNKDYMHFLIFKNEETGSRALVPKDSFPKCGK